MCRKYSGCESGQTLIEVVVALSVAVVVISSILGLITASNRKATLARQSSEATKLVQEGLEIVRNIRDSNAQVVEVGLRQGGTFCSIQQPPVPPGHFCSFNELYDIEQTTLSTEDNHLDNSGYYIVAGAPDLFNGDNEARLLNGVFSRKIKISDTAIGSSPPSICGDTTLTFSQVKRVTVEVDWNSPSGLQTKQSTTCLTIWK
jgi:Tfp pilus assembly protein PilV